MIVTAIVRPFVLSDVRASMEPFDVGMTVSAVAGYGCRDGDGPAAGVRVEIVVDDDTVDTVIETVTGAARTGRSGDGRVWVVAVDTAVRVRTGERGVEAL